MSLLVEIMYSQLNKNDFHYVGRYKCPLLYNQIVNQWVNREQARLYGFHDINSTSLWLDGHWFSHIQDWNEPKRLLLEAIENKDEAFFQNFYEKAQEDINWLLSVIEHASKCVTPHTIQLFFKTFQDTEMPWILTLPYGELLEDYIREKAPFLSNEQLHILFTPARKTKTMQHQENLKNLKKKLIEKNIYLENLSSKEALALVSVAHPELHEKIKQHVNEYSWVGMMHFWGSPYHEEKCIEDLKHVSEHQEKQTQDIDLPENIEWLKQHIKEIVYLRNNFAELGSFATYKSSTFLEHASQQFGLSWKEARWLSIEEFLEGMQGKDIPSQTIIEERKKAYGLIQFEGKNHILTGEKLKNVLHPLLTRSVEQTVSGLVAHPGKVQGKVKIILTPMDIIKVEKGDIIISPETTPDFLPAIHTSVAIVTDQGGIISHAAIVAREFKKPCIVGTKYATQIFKDGDYVEVDAEQGIVRKL